MIPAFAVVKKANNAAIVMAIYPGIPLKVRAAPAIGVRERLNSSGLETPTVTINTAAYRIVTTAKDEMRPRGMFLCGFFTSSDILAIFKRDRKSTRLNSIHIPLSRMPSSA